MRPLIIVGGILLAGLVAWLGGFFCGYLYGSSDCLMVML